ncbi:MAG: dihydrofolate reductase family protein [Deltaproteobacteria bacterium]|nr:dihydrofolate reductase family protein [Deltaproteobacteria bacterium]
MVSLPEGTHGLSVGTAISDLGRMGARTVLIEGGAMLNYAALSEGVVDEIYLTIAQSCPERKVQPLLQMVQDTLGSHFFPSSCWSVIQ